MHIWVDSFSDFKNKTLKIIMWAFCLPHSTTHRFRKTVPSISNGLTSGFFTEGTGCRIGSDNFLTFFWYSLFY